MSVYIYIVLYSILFVGAFFLQPHRYLTQTFMFPSCRRSMNIKFDEDPTKNVIVHGGQYFKSRIPVVCI